MLLAIDIGNTNIVCGLWEGAGWAREWRLSTDARRSADEYQAILQTLAGAAQMDLPARVDGVVIGSVVPAVTETFGRLCQTWLGREPLIVHVGLDLGMEVRVREPRRVGVDRLLNALAARAHFGAPVISLDFGTATKFDVVTADGAFAGGAIAPGLMTAADALVRNTAQLPRIDFVIPPRAIGDDTTSAMQSGIILGYLSLVEGLLARIQAELAGGPAPVVATGGLATLMTPLTQAIDHCDPLLTLAGLQLVYERQRQRSHPFADGTL